MKMTDFKEYYKMNKHFSYYICVLIFSRPSDRASGCNCVQPCWASIIKRAQYHATGYYTTLDRPYRWSWCRPYTL